MFGVRFRDAVFGVSLAAWALIAVALLPVAAVWLTAVAYLHQAQADAERVAAGERRNVALALAGHVEAVTAQADDMLLGMRRHWVDGGPAAFRREDRARAALARQSAAYEQMVVFGADGRILYATPRGFISEVVSAADLEHFAVHRRDPPIDELHVGRPFFGRVVGRWHVQMTRPIIDADGRFAGVLAASIRPERFAALYGGIALGPGGVIAVVRNTGEYVARSERHDEVVGRPAMIGPVAELDGRTEGAFRGAPEADGVERFYTWRQVPQTPLYLYVGQPVAEIMAPVTELRRRVYGGLGGFTLLSGGLLFAFLRAARQRGRALTALRAGERRFRSMFENANSGISFVDADGRFVDANDAFLRQLGYRRDELLLRTVADISDPDDMAWEAPLFAELRQGIRREYRMEKRCRAKDGDTIWFDLCAGAVRDDDGVARLFVGVTVDVTERKRNEAALATSNAELEQFGYVASHDLRQPLRMVTSYLTLLERDAGDRLTDDEREFLCFARDGAQRMDQMLVSLLEYSRVGRRGEPKATHDSRALLDEALLFVSPDVAACGATVTVTGEWPQVEASRNEMVRLFQNLLSNALKYREPGHAPQMTVTAARRGDEWAFSVSDDGIGFPPDQAGRLFKVFQRLTTRDLYEGAGVGLAVCRKIVERHGGRIWAETEGAGRGATFTFTLPVALPVAPPVAGEPG